MPTPRLTFGDAFIRTDHVPGANGLVPRRNVEDLPGANVLLRNGSDQQKTVTITVTYPSTTSRFEFVLEPRSEQRFHLEVPPYYAAVAASGAALPECTNPLAYPVTIRFEAAGAPSHTLDNCEYLHAVVAARR